MATLSLFVVAWTGGVCQDLEGQLKKAKDFDGWTTLVAKCMAKGVQPGNSGVDLFYSGRDRIKPKDTPRLIGLLQASMANEKLSDFTSAFVNLLWRRGDEKFSIPIFYAIATKTGEKWKPLFTWQALANAALMKSNHNLAIQYKLHLLGQKSINIDLKQQAYCSVAATGNRKAIQTVLDMRKQVETIEPLRIRIGIGQLGESPSVGIDSEYLAMGADASGVKWLLMCKGEVGSHADLWLSKWSGKEWETPVYIGINVHDDTVKPKTSGVNIGDWLKQDWLKLVTRYDDFRTDSDCDGLTDLVEKRLGTNATDRDTDQDAVPDDIDPNPLSGKPTGLEDEKVLKVAFESWTLFNETFYPYVVLLPKSAGHPDLTHKGVWVLAYPEKPGVPATKLFGQGPVFVRIIEKNGHAVRYSADRKEAALEMSVGNAPLNGTTISLRLRKFGKEWIVINSSRLGSA